MSVRHPPRGRPRNPRPLGGRARCRPRVPRSARCSPLDRRFRCPPPLPPAYPVLPPLPPPPAWRCPGVGVGPVVPRRVPAGGGRVSSHPSSGNNGRALRGGEPRRRVQQRLHRGAVHLQHRARLQGGRCHQGRGRGDTHGWHRRAAPLGAHVPTPPRAAGPALLHALHFPHGAARPPPGADAGGLGGQQRHHGDGGRVGQPPGAVLDDQDRAQGGCGGRGRPCRVPSFSGGGLGGCWALWRSLTLAFCPPPLESQLLRLAAAGLHCMPGCRPHRRRLRAIPGPAAHGAPQRHRL